MDIFKNLSLHHIYRLVTAFVCGGTVTTVERGGKGRAEWSSECLSPSSSAQQTHLSVSGCIICLCWRLRVLCMKIKCALRQLCPQRKTDGLLLQTCDLWARNGKRCVCSLNNTLLCQVGLMCEPSPSFTALCVSFRHDGDLGWSGRGFGAHHS